MKHCILVKFVENVEESKKKELIPEIKELFNHTKEIEGVHFIEVIENCVDRSNRYDLLIRMDMEKDALEEYDACKWHKMWKDEYGDLLEKKAIFDYEE